MEISCAAASAQAEVHRSGLRLRAECEHLQARAEKQAARVDEAMRSLQAAQTRAAEEFQALQRTLR